MGYENYGIDRTLVERVKLKMKNPEVKERVKMVLHDISKEDLQDRGKVKRLLGQSARVLGENISENMVDNITNFVVAQKINPNNTFHLIKLYGMIR